MFIWDHIAFEESIFWSEKTDKCTIKATQETLSKTMES